MIRSAIFDMDGLLFDTEAYYQKAFSELSIKYIGYKDNRAGIIASGTNGFYLLKKLQEAYPNIDSEAYVNEVQNLVYKWVKKEIPIKPGAKEILDYLSKKEFKLAIASSSRVEIIKHNLKKTQFEKYFDVVMSSLEVKHPKPAPDLFIAVANRMGVFPSECYVLEDSINGVRAGIAAGFPTIMVPDLKAPLTEFYSVCAGIYKDLYEVKEAIDKGEI